jgi:GT2 family glycosyltransferase
MNHPSTTIIVLAYNNVDMSKRFLNALYNNTSNFNLILIDNNSTDGSVEYFKDFSVNRNNITLIFNESNLGVIGGRNQGYDTYQKIYEKTKDDYFVFLDNDQICQKNWLLDHHDFMKKGNYDIIGVEAWLLSSAFWPVKNCKKPGEPFSYVGCGGMMIKKYVSDKIGMFDEIYNPCYFEDPDFCIRAMQNGFSIGWNYRSNIIHIPHQTLGKINQSKRHKLLINSHSKFKDKWKKIKIRNLYQHKIDCIENCEK